MAILTVVVGLGMAIYFMLFMIADTSVPIVEGFLPPEVVAFVVVGSLGCTMARNSVGDFFRMLGSVGKYFYYSQPDQLQLVNEIVELANVNRRDGPIAMQNIEVKNKFLQKAVNLVVDGTDAGIIEATLNTEIALQREREKVTVDMLKFWADVAPSFGMIGTMIGLVGMLKNMDDLKGIGDSFAIALLTTLWGAVVAYVVCKPWAEKLEGYSKSDMLINQLILEGCLLIKGNTNPRLIADRLSSRLATKAREEMAKNNAEAA